jgi:hypothetical protein
MRSGAAVLTRLIVALAVLGIAAPPVIAAPSAAAGSAGRDPSVDRRDDSRRAPRIIDVRAIAAGDVDRPAQQRAIDPTLGRPTAETPRTNEAPAASEAAEEPPPPPMATVVARDPIARAGWNGLAQTDADVADSSPINPSIAVGPDHVVQSASRQLRITDRQGGDVIEVEWADFFGLPTEVETFNRDPRVIYDALHGRWIALETSWDCQGFDPFLGFGYIDYAVSATSDPTGTWYGDWLGFADQVPWIPAAGTSTTMVSIVAQIGSIVGACPAGGASSTFGWEGFLFDWPSLMTGDTEPWVDSGLVMGQSLRPAIQTPATSPVLHFFGTGSPSSLSGNGNALYLRVSGSLASGTASFGTPIDLTASGTLHAYREANTVAPKQPGESINGGLPFANTEVVWQANRLVTTMSQQCLPNGTDPQHCIRVTELGTTNATPAVVQDFYLGEAGRDSYLSSVALAGDGALHVAWNRSSAAAGDYIGAVAAHQAPGDPVNQVGTTEVIVAGEATYTPSSGWGTYQALTADPQVPGAVWQAAPYAAADGHWATTVSTLRRDGSTYVPITPLRVLDTRNGTGLSGAFTSGQARTWFVAGVGAIPADAVAVTGNLTVTGQQTAGYVAVTPTLTNAPPTSTINFPLGDTRANNLVISLSSSGTLSAMFKGGTGKKAHILLDVTGYFVAGDDGATFTPLAPVRVLDSRSGVGLDGPFAMGVPKTLMIAGTGGIPDTATAITGNLTVTQQSKAGLLAVTKDPVVSPATSTLNFPAGDTRANGVFAPLDEDGALSIVYRAQAGATTHVLLDVTGYFVPGDAGLRFVPLLPGRVMDTRPGAVLSGLTGKFTADTPRVLGVAGHFGVPTGTTAVTGNLTVTSQNGGGFIAATPEPVVGGSTSTLNFPLADTRANGFVGMLADDSMALVFEGTTGRTTHLLLDLTGYFE